MRIYTASADCLVDDVLLHFDVIARNEREAWIKAYLVALNNSVMDSGTIDVVRKKFVNN